MIITIAISLHHYNIAQTRPTDALHRTTRVKNCSAMRAAAQTRATKYDQARSVV